MDIFLGLAIVWFSLSSFVSTVFGVVFLIYVGDYILNRLTEQAYINEHEKIAYNTPIVSWFAWKVFKVAMFMWIVSLVFAAIILLSAFF